MGMDASRVLLGIKPADRTRHAPSLERQASRHDNFSALEWRPLFEFRGFHPADERRRDRVRHPAAELHMHAHGNGQRAQAALGLLRGAPEIHTPQPAEDGEFKQIDEHAQVDRVLPVARVVDAHELRIKAVAIGESDAEADQFTIQGLAAHRHGIAEVLLPASIGRHIEPSEDVWRLLHHGVEQVLHARSVRRDGLGAQLVHMQG